MDDVDFEEGDELLVEVEMRVNARITLRFAFPAVVVERVVGARLHSVTCNGKCGGQCGEHE